MQVSVGDNGTEWASQGKLGLRNRMKAVEWNPENVLEEYSSHSEEN